MSALLLGPSGTLAVLAMGLAVGCAEEPVVWPTRAELVEVVAAAAQVDDAPLRAEVIRLAARSQIPEFDEVIRAAAADRAPIVRAAALEAILRGGGEGLDDSLYERLSAEDEAGRRTAFDLILRFGSEELRNQVVDRSLRHTSAPFRRFAFRRVVLEQHAAVSVSQDVLARALEAEDPVVAAEVVDLLSSRGERRALDPVKLLLQGEDAQERGTALRVLAVTPSLDSWPVLRWIRRHGDLEEQRLAVLAMARLGDPTVADDVRELLRTGEESLIPLALLALAGLPGSDSQRQVASHKADTRAEVRRAALHSLLVLEAPPEELVDFIEDPEPDIASWAAEVLLDADIRQLVGRVCPELRLATDPVPLLRFLWLLESELGSSELTTACTPQLEALMSSDSPDVQGIAARLYFSTVDPDPNRYLGDRREALPVLYAYLDASLDRDPASYRALYRELLGHELLIVRVVAALGLLGSTPG